MEPASMQLRSIVVVGAGGFGRETVDLIQEITAAGTGHYRIVGVVDPNPDGSSLKWLESMGISHLGGDENWLGRVNADYFALAIGDPQLRSRLARRYVEAGVSPATLLHPSAQISRHSVVGVGSILCARSVVSTNVTIGAQVHVNANATIGHDVVLGDSVSVNPGAIVSGRVTIEGGALIGAGAVVLEGRRVGFGCVVGASACVTRDVPAGLTVKGIPAK